MIQDFFVGVEYFISGFHLITLRGVKRYVIIPFLINILLFVALFFVLKHYTQHFAQWLQVHLPHWLSWLISIMWGFVFLLFILFFIFAFLAIANLIAAPFNSLLSEQIEYHLKRRRQVVVSLWQNIKDVPASIKRQLLWMGYYLPRAAILFLLFFIPIIQMIAMPLWFLFNAWVMTLATCDYPAGNHRVSYQTIYNFLRQHRLISLGFGMTMLFCSMIPFINFLTIPVAVAGATKFWIERYPQS